jgi:thymidylate synthase (FAD)
MWVTPDAEHLISDMARVSNPSNQGNYETADRLIRYLIKHRHWSPFEMASMCLEINTTRGIAAQILRHRSFSFQEFSQRYADVKELTNIALPELRRQDTKNRQNSTDDLEPEVVEDLNNKISVLFEQSNDLYNELLEKGVAKECARFILPIATPSRLYMTGTIRSWMHYIDLRSANGTQKEHMDIALECKSILERELPNVCTAMWGE